MGLLDPLTEYLQARGGLVVKQLRKWPGCPGYVGIPRTGPGPDVSRPCQDAYIQDTPLDLAAVDELLQENEYLGNQKFWWTRCLCRFFSLHRKSVWVFFVKGECSQILLASFWRLFLYFTLLQALTSWNLQGMISNHFQQDLSSCGLVTRLFAGSHKHQLCSPKICLQNTQNCWQLVVITTTLHCQGQDRLELFRGGRNDSVTLCLFEWGNRSKRATRQ